MENSFHQNVFVWTRFLLSSASTKLVHKCIFHKFVIAAVENLRVHVSSLFLPFRTAVSFVIFLSSVLCAYLKNFKVV